MGPVEGQMTALGWGPYNGISDFLGRDTAGRTQLESSCLQAKKMCHWELDPSASWSWTSQSPEL